MSTRQSSRKVTLTRTTGETDVTVSLDLDGTGRCDVGTGVGFFDHMLDALGRHALIDLEVKATGDSWVDDHHTVEDVGIVMGRALRQALGDKAGIRRFSDVCVAMDEALVLAAIDVSGRGELYWELPIPAQKVGGFDTELAREFFSGLARDGGITLHVRRLAGENSHHLIECAFKAVARALRAAVEGDPRVSDVPSTKGSL
ncbi:imidazoleglycerol-phosphate dehydratase HisB [Olsenella sp. HMSC062G07]|uniref:imidazoleglycerol-phosphate dehydratase HisB n=1 Tax=Olsenella sp. HMSC062G07 TaxID=1739330 RepID=UPI0008A3D72F|nr:imidazoleglycerol-phosphate dehydratase HisB [Olsenella sp. HMSC062G07]OFK24767.1 imidazoleglycerol-phosphate dehydratase [Olsenella sp. HMSC062G07]